MTIALSRSETPSRTRLAICIAAVAACLPYAALKIAWIAGSDIGTADADAADLMHDTATVIGNVVTLGLELGAVAIVAALTFVRRIPPLLVLGPIWVGTGLLAPVVIGLPTGLAAQAVAGGAPAPDDSGLHGWVFVLVYGGFIIQAPLLVGAFLLRAADQWPWVFRLHGPDVIRGATYPLQALMARVAVVVGMLIAIVYALWTIDANAFYGPNGFETVAQRTFLAVDGAFPIAGALGVLALVRRARPGSMRVPLGAAWIGSAASFSAAVLPLMDHESAFGSFVASVSGMLGVGLAITALLVLADARPPDQRVSTMRRILPTERSTVSGSTTSMSTVTPISFLILARRSAPTAVADSRTDSARRSTSTVIESILPSRVSTHWKWGDSCSVRKINSSICVGNRLTPRRMIMSSVRPVIFSIRRIVRAVPGSSRVRSRVR